MIHAVKTKLTVKRIHKEKMSQGGIHLSYEDNPSPQATVLSVGEEVKANVRVGDVVDSVRGRAEAGFQQRGVDVLRLRLGRAAVALTGEQQLAVEFVGAALGHHVDEHARRAHGDVLRAARHLDVLERARIVVVHREALRRRVVHVDAIEHLRVLRVGCAARREGALQAGLVAADVGRVAALARLAEEAARLGVHRAQRDRDRTRSDDYRRYR